jgi:hypothetical protein
MMMKKVHAIKYVQACLLFGVQDEMLTMVSRADMVTRYGSQDNVWELLALLLAPRLPLLFCETESVRQKNNPEKKRARNVGHFNVASTDVSRRHLTFPPLFTFYQRN